MKVIDIRCPGCGNPSSTAAAECKYCGRQLMISSFSTLHTISPAEVSRYVSSYTSGLAEDVDVPEVHAALGMCYLKLGLFPQAKQQLELGANAAVHNPEVYFYSAVARLEGKRPFVTPLATIRECEALTEAAAALEPRAVFQLMLAYVARDYYERKFLNRTQSSVDHLDLATRLGLTATDIAIFKEVVRQQDLGLPV